MTLNFARPLVFFLFVFAGYYKAADYLRAIPVDLTLAFGLATVLFCLWMIGSERKLPRGSLPMAALFLVFVLGLRWTDTLADYPMQKSLRLFTVTAVSAFAPLALLRTTKPQMAFALAIVMLGCVMALLAVIELLSGGISRRIEVLNVNPILLARASGHAALVLFLLFLRGRLGLFQVLFPSTVVLVALLASGARGPLLALVLTVGISLLAFKMTSPEIRRGLLALGATGIVGAASLVWLADERSGFARRILRLFTGTWGDTETTRLALWHESLHLARDTPLGLGWGRFSESVQVLHDERVLALYPHNIVLEIFVEAGWLPGLIFVCFVSWVLVATYKRVSCRDSLNSWVIFSGLIYWLLCAMVSGNVNDNRPFWAFLGVALASALSSLTRDAAAKKGKADPA